MVVQVVQKESSVCAFLGDDSHEMSLGNLSLRGDTGRIEQFSTRTPLRLEGIKFAEIKSAMAKQTPNGEVAFMELRGPTTEGLLRLEGVFGTERLFQSLTWRCDSSGRLLSVMGLYPQANCMVGQGYAVANLDEMERWQVVQDNDFRGK